MLLASKGKWFSCFQKKKKVKKDANHILMLLDKLGFFLFIAHYLEAVQRDRDLLFLSSFVHFCIQWNFECYKIQMNTTGAISTQNSNLKLKTRLCFMFEVMPVKPLLKKIQRIDIQNPNLLRVHLYSTLDGQPSTTVCFM